MSLANFTDRLLSRQWIRPKRIALALSGGSVRGCAHVGVLEVLEREGLHPHLVIGTSAGSMAGGLFCAGVSTERMRQELADMRWSKMARLARPGLGLFDTARLETHLEKVMGGPVDFDDLQIPFVAVASDLASRKPILLTEGRLARAVRASCSLPGIFLPTEVDGRLLVDGGIVANLPVSLARQLGADYVIAVDLLSVSPGDWTPNNLSEMWMLTYYTVMRKASQEDRKLADVLIEPDMGRFNMWDFSQWPEMIAAGRAATELVMPQLRRDLKLFP